MLGFFDAHCRTQFRIVFFTLFKFIVMSIPVPYYQYYCSLFGCTVLVYILPCGNYAHYYLGYGIHTIDELPF